MDYVSLPVSIHSSIAPLLLQLLPLLHSSCSSYAPAPSVHYTLIYFVAAAAAAAVSRRRFLSLIWRTFIAVHCFASVYLSPICQRGHSLPQCYYCSPCCFCCCCSWGLLCFSAFCDAPSMGRFSLSFNLFIHSVPPLLISPTPCLVPKNGLLGVGVGGKIFMGENF